MEEEDWSESEQISDSFACAVCLDLVYKPIILACGHISCFWCVHKSMNFHRESHCPICRHAYQHFPAISKILHFLLYKIYPITYKRRENQILEMEKQNLEFSPDLGSPVANEKPDSECIKCQSSTARFQDNSSINSISMGKEEAWANAPPSESSTYGTSHSNEISAVSFKTFSSAAVEEKNMHNRVVYGNWGHITVTDVHCAACKQMLYRPVALNCGHLYCEVCIINTDTGKIRCQDCECTHSGDFPKVCLVLDHFLEEQFPSEYAQRKGSAQLKQIQHQKWSPTMDPAEASKKSCIPIFPTDENFDQWLAENRSRFHAGVGCDSCGMVPIIGDRYKCQDCTEKMGFDLCGDCYNTRSKLAGRFNQQHTSEHRLEKILPQPQPIYLAYRLYLELQLIQAGTPLSSNDFEDGSVSPDYTTDRTEDQSGNQSPL